MDPWIGSSTAPNASGFSSNHSNASSADNINAVSANRISLQPRPASAGVVSPPSWSPAPLPSLSQQLQHDPSAASSFATAAPEDRREEPLASFPPTSLSHPDPARKHPAFTGSSLARPGSEFDRSYPSLPHSDDIGPTDTGPAYMSSADERRHIRPASSQHTPDPYYKLQSNSPRPYIAGEGFPGTPVASRSRMDPSPVSTPGHPRFLPRQSESNETSPSERRDPYRSYDSAADDSSLSPGFMHPIKSSSSSAASSPLPSGLRRPIDSRLSSGAPLHAASHEDLSGASIDSSGSVHGLGRPGPEPDSHFSNAFRPWASTPDKSFPTFKDERYSQGSPVYRSDRMTSSDSLHSASGPIKTDAHTHPAESPSPFDSRAYSSEWDHRPSQREPFKDISLPGLGPHHSDTPADSRFREEQPSERPKGSEVDRTRYDPGPYGSQYATAPAHTHGEDTTSSASSHRWSSSRQYPSEAQLLGRPARPYSIPGDPLDSRCQATAVPRAPIPTS
ncbi:uncharacterized protein BJ171DRAFT_191212 [Polychytrium aggregatum]|uniref:uncharacterized protein n=1 Tax=Polychytrium aggregatum TaxID=110093 RepID=UPI0022FEE40B|nr:uncharacterized protein BJ171DRAFT_191212 [Polychytrium aggregatum]KAI9202101.1 hypothetical protein BJ171DRAFT_191212 [Polychytrium aggregatum]